MIPDVVCIVINTQRISHMQKHLLFLILTILSTSYTMDNNIARANKNSAYFDQVPTPILYIIFGNIFDQTNTTQDAFKTFKHLSQVSKRIYTITTQSLECANSIIPKIAHTHKKLSNDDEYINLINAALDLGTSNAQAWLIFFLKHKLPGIQDRTCIYSILIHRTYAQQDIRAVSMLLTAGANPNPVYFPYTSDTPLGLATKNNNTTLVEMLLKAGADPNTQYSSYCMYSTPLQCAAFINNFNIANMLINFGANINTPSYSLFGFQSFNTALHIAADRGSVKIVALLLTTNVDVSLRNTQYKTALDKAKEQKDSSIVKLLKTYVKMQKEAQRKPSDKLLRKVILLGYASIVEQILKCLPINASKELEYANIAQQKFEETNIKAYKTIADRLYARVDTLIRN